MSLHANVTRVVNKAPDGPQIGAFFDFDGTLMAGFSVTEFLKEKIRRGELSASDFIEMVSTIGSFSVGRMGFSGLMSASARLMNGITEQSYIEFGEEVYEKQIARLIYPESRALVQAHLRKGHTVAIVSSATPYQVEPAARDLDIEHVLCSKLKVENGEFTGEVIKPLCWGEGKVIAAEGLAKSYNVDLGKSFFYTDSDDDLELLERVGNPQPLNPNARLVEIAETRGWPVRRFKSRGRPRATDFLRSLAADLSLIPIVGLALPIWALTGSKREAQNFSFSLFADVASAFIGLNLNVKGEHHLWEKRPAIFVFNHQSKADVMITAKLLRRDIVGVGKKEIGKIPLIGRVMEFGGAVLIDRENAASAIETMKPLVDVVRVERKSVLISPEGTRTITPKLGPFKKGPFHLAMQAGVPMVPIVIHNAGDVAPKGELVYRRGTVEVEVLPPIDTSNWTVKTINEHVAEVRGMFLAALDQRQESKATKPQSPPRPKSQSKADRKIESEAEIRPSSDVA